MTVDFASRGHGRGQSPTPEERVREAPAAHRSIGREHGPRQPGGAGQVVPEIHERNERTRRESTPRAERRRCSRPPEPTDKQVQAESREDEMQKSEDREVAPGADEEIEPGQRIEQLVVGLAHIGCPKDTYGFQSGQEALGQGLHERLELRRPVEMEIARVEHPSGENGLMEEERHAGDEDAQDNQHLAPRPRRRLLIQRRVLRHARRGHALA